MALSRQEELALKALERDLQLRYPDLERIFLRANGRTGAGRTESRDWLEPLHVEHASGGDAWGSRPWIAKAAIAALITVGLVLSLRLPHPDHCADGGVVRREHIRCAEEPASLRNDLQSR